MRSSVDSSGVLITTSDLLANSSGEELIQEEIKQLYDKLNRSIEGVNRQVEHVIQKNQSEFLLAYRNHLNKINKELSDIKRKSEEQEKMFSANDRIKYLEKEVQVFREEAIQIYDKLEKVTEEANFYKQKYESLSRDFLHVERDNKDSINSAKISDSQKGALEKKIFELEMELAEKQKEIEKLSSINKKIKERMDTSRIGLSPNFMSMKSEGSKNRYDEEKSIRFSSAGKNSRVQPLNNEFQEYFFDCVNVLKKQIAFRKYANKLNLNTTNKLEDFRKIDKLKVLELFLKNSELQSWMYEKLFPNKTLNEITKGANYEQNEEQIHAQILQTQTERMKSMTRYTKFSQGRVGFRLPKMDKNRTKSNFPRSSINM